MNNFGKRIKNKHGVSFFVCAGCKCAGCTYLRKLDKQRARRRALYKAKKKS